MLSVFLLHCHDGAYGICYILAASVRHYPLMRIVGYNIPSCLALHGGATGSCVACLCLHILTPFPSFSVLRSGLLQSC